MGLSRCPGCPSTDDGGDAVDLFAARAAATGDPERPIPAGGGGLPALDGMALAIELAAARYSTLGLDGLEDGLDERLRFLTGGPRAADRHRSLRAAIDWSYDLLRPTIRPLLRGSRGVRVVVRRRRRPMPSTAAAASGPAVADVLARLADHSLLVVERGEPTRYRALETIRQYGRRAARRDG